MISKEKKICKKTKWLSEEALQITEERRKAKCKGERKIYAQLNAEFQRRARRDKKAFLNEKCKKKKKKREKTNRMEKMKELLKGTEDIKGKIPVRKGMIKD